MHSKSLAAQRARLDQTCRLCPAGSNHSTQMWLRKAPYGVGISTLDGEPQPKHSQWKLLLLMPRHRQLVYIHRLNGVDNRPSVIHMHLSGQCCRPCQGGLSNMVMSHSQWLPAGVGASGVARAVAGLVSYSCRHGLSAAVECRRSAADSQGQLTPKL